MSSSQGQNKKPKKPVSDNFLEALRDLGADSAKQTGDLAREVPKDFFKQLLGIEKPGRKTSGTFEPGQEINVEEALSGQLAEREEKEKAQRRLYGERRRSEEEQVASQKKIQELQMELHALSTEVLELAKSTSNLSEEVRVAAIQAPANPGVYHVVFFEKLRSFIISFRKKIENASEWLQAYNGRSRKMQTFWGQVGKHGAKRLLSFEDYTQRSAG